MNDRPLTQSLAGAFQRAGVPSSLEGLTVAGQSRGMYLPKGNTQKSEKYGHKNSEGYNTRRSRKDHTMSKQSVEAVETNVKPEEIDIRVARPQRDSEAIKQFGGQLASLLSGASEKLPARAKWKVIGEDVAVFTVKTGVVAVAAVGVMAIAKHMTKSPTDTTI